MSWTWNWNPLDSNGGFLADFGKTLASGWGVAEHGVGAVADFVDHSPGEYNPTTGEYTGEWDKMVQSFGQMLHNAKETLGPLGEGTAAVMQGDQWLYSNAVSRPLSTVLLMGDYMGSEDNKWFKGKSSGDNWWHDPFFNTGTIGTLFDPSAWSSAWSRAKHVSPGQALVGGFSTDMSDDQAIQDAKQDWWFSMVSGTFDAGFSMSMDPLGKLGKAFKFTPVAHATEETGTVLSRIGSAPKGLSTAAPAIKASEDLPITDFDTSSLNRIRGHLGKLQPSDVEDLYHYEQANGARPSVLTMLQNRYTKLGGRQFEERADTPLSSYVPPGVQRVFPGKLKQSSATAESVAAQTSPTSQLLSEKAPIHDAFDWMQKVADKYGPAAATVIAKHPLLKNVPQAGLIASLYANADPATRVLITKVGWGDKQAYDQIGDLDKALQLRLQQLNNARRDLMTAEGRLGNAADKATNADRLATVQQEIDALERQSQILTKATSGGANDQGIFGLMPNTMKGTPGGTLLPGPLGKLNATTAGMSASARARIGNFNQAGNFNWRGFTQGALYYNSYNIPMKILGTAANLGRKTPQGYLDVDDPEAWREVDNMLASVKGFDPGRRAELVSQYMNASTEWQKMEAAKTAESEALKHIGDLNGLTPEQIDSVVSENMAQRDAVRAMIQNKAYSTATDADGRRIDWMDTDNGAVAIMPVLATQLANKIPLTDMRVIQTAMSRNRSLVKAVTGLNLRKGADVTTQLADVMSSAWKLSNFARLGYLVRVVSDDGLAYLAKMDAMTALRPSLKGIANIGFNQGARAAMSLGRLGYRMGKVGDVALDRAFQATGHGSWLSKQGDIPQLSDAGTIPHGLTKDNFQENIKRQVGQQDIEITVPGKGGKQVITAQGFAPRGDAGDYWRGLASDNSRRYMESYGSGSLDRLRGTLSWNLVNQGEANYESAWLHAANNQLGKDALARQILAGKSDKQVLQWLTRDREGIQYSQRLPFWSSDKPDWIARVRHFVDAYVPDITIPRETVVSGQTTTVDESMRVLAMRQKLTEDSLRNVPDGMKPGQVHGALLDYNMGQGGIIKTMQRVQEGFYRVMNEVPTDVLVRHPLANELYRQRLTALVRQHVSSEDVVDNDALRMYETAARQHAIKNINQVVLDLGRHSNAAHMFRFVMPFYNAWEQALTRWGRLVYSDPGILFKGNRLWQGMSNMPIAFDQQQGNVQDVNGNVLYGNVIGPDGKPTGQFKHGFSGLSSLDQLMTFRMPKFMADRLGFNTNVQIPKSSLNLVLQGDPWWLPSFGPVVQAPVSQVVASHPEMMKDFTEILPFGPQGVTDTFAPTSLRKLKEFLGDRPGSWLADPDAEAASSINVWRQMYTQWLVNGKKGPMPQYSDKEVAKRSSRLRGLAFFSQLLSPVNLRYTSPNKFYLDQYHKLLQAQGPVNGRAAFISKYPEYFLYADSISKNNAGIPATSDAYHRARMYRDLISQNPDIAGAIVASGPQYQNTPGSVFNTAVYNQQFQQEYQVGSNKTMREHQDLKSFATGAMAQQGWDQYSKLMNLVHVELAKRGLQSTSQSGAEDLDDIRKQVIFAIAKSNPDWRQEYLSFDPTKQQRTVDQLTNMVNDPQFQKREGDREEVKNLANYLTMRNFFIGQLAQRKSTGGSADITAQSNADLYQAWQYLRDQLAHQRTAFQAQYFDRYLAQDDRLKYDPAVDYKQVSVPA